MLMIFSLQYLSHRVWGSGNDPQIGFGGAVRSAVRAVLMRESAVLRKGDMITCKGLRAHIPIWTVVLIASLMRSRSSCPLISPRLCSAKASLIS